MRHAGRFALTLVLSVGLVGAAVVGAVTHEDRDELPVADLLRVEPLPSGVSPVDDQIRFQFEVLGGIRRWTDTEVTARFVPELAAQFTARDLNQQTDALVADGGSISFVRVTERQPEFVTALGVDQVGEAGELLFVFTDDGRIAGLNVVDSGNPRRLPSWQSTLILLGASALIAAAAAAWRYRAASEAWTLLAASLPAMTAVLVLANSSAAYSAAG